VSLEVERGEVAEAEHEDGDPVEEDRVRDRVERVGVGHLRVDLRRVAHLVRVRVRVSARARARGKGRGRGRGRGRSRARVRVRVKVRGRVRVMCVESPTG
jgi:hypothetical protein